jgi:hypothetical protein
VPQPRVELGFVSWFQAKFKLTLNHPRTASAV